MRLVDSAQVAQSTYDMYGGAIEELELALVAAKLNARNAADHLRRLEMTLVAKMERATAPAAPAEKRVQGDVQGEAA